MLFDQFREVPFDELSQRTIVQSEPSGQRSQALGRRAVQPYDLGVFGHAAPRYRSAIFRLGHPLTGVQFRLVLFQILTETFGLKSKLGRHGSGGEVALLEPGDGIGIFGLGRRVVLSHLRMKHRNGRRSHERSAP